MDETIKPLFQDSSFQEMAEKGGWIYDAESRTYDYIGHPYSIDDPYWIDEDRINTPEKALGLLHHVCKKTWMDAWKAHWLIGLIAKRNGWKIHKW